LRWPCGFGGVEVHAGAGGRVAESGTRGLGTPVVGEEHVTAVEEESGSTRGLAAV
jgi:hypothetical protein